MKVHINLLNLVILLALIPGCLGGNAGPGRTRPSNSREKADLQVIRSLLSAGSDFSKPHSLEHFFIATNTDGLAEAIVELERKGYLVTEPEEYAEGVWVVMAVKPILITDKNVFGESALMEQIAAQFGLEYDGWGCEIVR